MGRRSIGPVRLNGGDTWYARLTVKPCDRRASGKTRLIRSLGTTDHSVALRRYGRMMQQLEYELKQLLAGNKLRQDVEEARTNSFWLDDDGVTPMDAGDIAIVHGWDNDNSIMEALYSGKKLGPTWEELIQLYIRIKSRTRARAVAPRTIKALELSVSRVRAIAEPQALTKQHVQKLIATMEQTLSPVTVKQQLALLSSLMTVAIRNDVLDGSNPFTLVDYAAVGNRRGRRAYTDGELRLLDGPLLWLVLTGMRPAELATRMPTDVEMGMIIVRANGDWRPKTLSSERRIPIPTGVEIRGYKNWNGETQRWRRDLRKLVGDQAVTPHSGRHTFAELGRRSGVEPRVMEALMGHGSSVGSRSTKKYGEYPDSVLKTEIAKVWALVDAIRAE